MTPTSPSVGQKTASNDVSLDWLCANPLGAALVSELAGEVLLLIYD